MIIDRVVFKGQQIVIPKFKKYIQFVKSSLQSFRNRELVYLPVMNIDFLLNNDLLYYYDEFVFTVCSVTGTVRQPFGSKMFTKGTCMHLEKGGEGDVTKIPPKN